MIHEAAKETGHKTLQSTQNNDRSNQVIPDLAGQQKEAAMKSILIKDTTREERIRIVQQSLWGGCGVDCEFCSGCDNRGGGRIESIYQPYIDGLKEIREINAEYSAPLVKG